MAITFSSTGGSSGITTITVSATSNNELTDIITRYTLSNGSGYSVPLNVVQKAYVPAEKYLTLTPSSFDWDASGGRASLTVNSNDEWTLVSNSWIALGNNGNIISIDEGERRRGEVVVIEEKYNILQGSGNAIIGLEYTKNGASDRTGFISGFCKSDSSITASTVVSQEGNYEDPYLILNTDRMDVESESATTAITVQSNVGWKVGSDSNWLRLQTISGTGDGTITFTVDENVDAYERKCYIVVSSTEGKCEGVVQVMQKSAFIPYIIPEPSSISVPSTGSSGNEIRISANCEYDISTESEWIRLDSTSGSGNETIYFDTLSAYLPKAPTNNGLIAFTNKDSGYEAYVDVIRNEATNYLTASVSELEASMGRNQSFTVAVSSNISWLVNIDNGQSLKEWISVQPVKGDGDLNITINTESGTTERTGYVQLYENAKNLSYTITIHQS